MILIIDNYDSFVYNLAQYLGEMGWEPAVYRNDRILLEDIESLRPTHIIISPGPGTPLDAGISNDVIRRFGGEVPILGVCLGHQCIGQVYGGEIACAPKPTHGKSGIISHDGKAIYKGLPNPFDGGRYHSLVIKREGFPDVLKASATTDDGSVIMGVRHRKYAVEGVQFHPESIMTDVGHDMLRNFLSFTRPQWSEE